MADKTTNFGMNLPLDSEIVDQELYNENFEILDTEVARRITAVNGIEAGEDGGVIINEVPFAKQIASEKQQQSSEEYNFRTTGGEASLDDGPATLVGIFGRSVHTGIINEVFNMTVTLGPREDPEEGEEPEEPITATIDKDTFIEYVENPASITVQLLYTDMWSANPSLYGITVTGTPVYGDAITVDYVRADRGTITPSNPTQFISTGWNLYNDDVGYARVKKYSDTYNFIVGGTYEALKFSDTYDGVRQDITVSSNRFSIPSDGYVWVTGGNAITTCIYMTWSDWTSGYEGEWKAYEESVVDFSEDAETAFPYGMCQVGPISDEIDFSLKRMIRRIERVAYSASTIETLINTGVAYDADTDYIYYVLGTPVVTECTVSNVYIANDHGLEMVDCDIAPLILTMYGENLVEKLSSDVLTISHQTLSASQQTQARMNIGVAGKIIPVISGTVNNSGYTINSGEYFEANGVLYKATASIPINNAWSSSATAQGDTVHGALNELNSKIAKLYLEGDSAQWANNVTLLRTLETYETKAVTVSAATMYYITGDTNVTGKGTVTRVGTDIYDFLLMVGNNQIYTIRLSSPTTTSTGTVTINDFHNYDNRHPIFSLGSSINNLEIVGDGTRIRSGIYAFVLALKVINNSISTGEKNIGTVDIVSSTTIVGVLINNANSVQLGTFVLAADGKLYINPTETISVNTTIRMCGIGIKN